MKAWKILSLALLLGATSPMAFAKDEKKATQGQAALDNQKRVKPIRRGPKGERTGKSGAKSRRQAGAMPKGGKGHRYDSEMFPPEKD